LLESDEFTITYDPGIADTDQMKSSIAELGYRPEIAPSRIDSQTQNQAPQGSIPDPVAAAIIKAGETGKLAFIDFHAEWCGACKVLDRTTFKDPTVIRTLEGFVFLKVDADEYPDATNYFNVVAMPTLIVVNIYGEEIYRQVGPIAADKLNEDLLSLRSEESVNSAND